MRADAAAALEAEQSRAAAMERANEALAEQLMEMTGRALRAEAALRGYLGASSPAIALAPPLVEMTAAGAGAMQ